MGVRRDTRVECLLCGPGMHGEPVLDGSLRRCVRCGFTWTTTSAERAARDLYDDGYHTGGGYRDYFKRAAQWRHEAGLRAEWLLSAVRPRTLLEAGSAGGFFVEAARRAGVDASGVEPTGACVRYARERLKVPVQQGYFEATAVHPVDVVCSFHVLEHTDDPRNFLAAAQAALIPGGWLALEVPNIDSNAARRRGGSWPGLQLEYHRWHFSPRTLLKLVESCGFLVCRCDTVFARYYMRPLHQLRPSGLAALAAGWSIGTSMRTPHSQRGENVRLLAQRPKGTPKA